ncbi:6-bladed beta-propeller [Sphingobacterium sp.]|uniref:6-bladed beta-propeller n=1 Tax=Sphingobacterium sp. TaxID=341027 RepID=UPI00258AE9DA|nr:6-bladed beta-propeller [Sphingobacterium sp.]WET69013.1 MAG: 6-bladed beta-propeller [Sphingobacterium sp.]
MNKFSILMIAILSYLGCVAQDKIITDTSRTITLRIDPENAIGANSSDVFEKITYIPLETNSQSIFGNINQLEVLKSYFIILDHNTNSILIFTRNGKFHAKIKGSTYIPIYAFTIDYFNNLIVYSTDNFESISYSNYDGKVVKKTEIKDIKSRGLYNLNFIYPNQNRIISYDQYRDFDKASKYYTSYSRSMLRFMDKEGNVKMVGLEYSDEDRKIDVLNSGDAKAFSNCGNTGKYYFTKPYDYSIYTISDHSIQLTYKMIFPLKYSLPSDFISNSAFNGKRGTFLQKNRSLIYHLSNVYSIHDNLIFKTNSIESSKFNTLIYALTSGVLISFKHIQPDQNSSFLPLYDDLSPNFNNVGLAFNDGENLYNSISSLNMFKVWDENKANNYDYDPILKNYFATQNAKSNPVIVQLKIKSSL